MKRIFVLLTALLAVVVLTACSNSSAPEELSEKFLKRDVQDYIYEMLDEDAIVTDFEKVDSEVNGDEMIVSCNVAFETDDEEKQGEFTLTYEVEDDAWVLSKCRVELDESSDSKKDSKKDDAADDEKDVEESEEEPEEELEEEPEEEPEEEKKSEKKNDKKEEKKEEPEEEPEEVELSDELYDFTFVLDGDVYKLPCSYQTFKNNGWTISSRGVTENDKITANSYEYVTMIKNGAEITVYPMNLSGNVKEIKDCKIGGIEVSISYLSDTDLFNMAKDITLDSTIDEIKEAFGDPNSISEYTDYTYITYEKESQQDVRFVVYTSGKKYNSITIRNFVSDASDVTETSKEVPEYLSEYVAPSELGTDPFSGNIEIEGDVYRVPAPVSAFIENGWKIVYQSNGIGAGNTDYISLERNGKKFSPSIVNLGEYQTIAANCVVYSVSPNDYDKISAKLPGGISFESTLEDVQNYVTDEYDYYEGTYSYSYDYYDYDIDFSLGIDVSVETKTVSGISIRTKNWDY